MLQNFFLVKTQEQLHTVPNFIVTATKKKKNLAQTKFGLQNIYIQQTSISFVTATDSEKKEPWISHEGI